MTWLSLRRACTHIALFGASFGIGVFAFAPAAQAYTYDGSRAASFAHDWSANGQALRNPTYNQYSQDCANFASQALVAGLLPQDRCSSSG
ncbi:MAG: amidase domain-containing protein [Sporichthyaceae bacterium]